MTDAEGAAEDDKNRKALALARNKAESLLYTSERALGELGHVLGDEDRGRLEGDIQANRATVRAKVADPALLAGIRAELLSPEVVQTVTDQLAAALNHLMDQRPKRAD